MSKNTWSREVASKAEIQLKHADTLTWGDQGWGGEGAAQVIREGLLPESEGCSSS